MNIVILAAGLGKRMRSALPKVLHPLAGRPLLAHVIETARSLSPTRLVVVVGHGGVAMGDAPSRGGDFRRVARKDGRCCWQREWRDGRRGERAYAGDALGWKRTLLLPLTAQTWPSEPKLPKPLE